MEPFEWAIISAMAAGTGLQVYGQYQQGKSAEQQAKSEAAWQAYNAKVALKNAEAEKVAGNFAASQQQRQAEMLLKRQRALIGKSGITMEGSPLLVAEDTAAQLALENTNIRLQSLTRQDTWKSQSILDTIQSQASKNAASGYGRAGLIGAGSSLLSGAGETAYAGYKMYSDKTKKPVSLAGVT